MIALVVLALAVLGGTTWLAMNQSVAGDPIRYRRLTSAGIGLCALTAAVALAAALGAVLVAGP